MTRRTRDTIHTAVFSISLVVLFVLFALDFLRNLH